MSTNSLVWNFIGHDKSAGKTVDSLSHKVGKLGATVGKAVGGVAVAGIAAFGTALVLGVKEAVAYQTLGLKTQAVLKSTGNQAHVSAKGVRALASRLEDLSGVDENLIINSQNVMLTFTRVRNEAGKGNDIFNQATTAALNMSTALGTDLQGATMAVAKALQDPVKGVNALRRAGVMLTEQQKKQIVTLVKHGKTMDAQKIILKELKTEFGGAAKAAGSGFQGSLARLRDAFSDAFRDVGTSILPDLTSLVRWLGQKAPQAIKVVMPVLRDVAKGISVFFAAISGHSETNEFEGGFKKVNNVAITLHDVFVNQVIPAVKGLWKAGSLVWNFLANQLFPVFRDAINKVMPTFRDGIDNLRKAFGNSGEAGGKLSKMFSDLWSVLKTYVIPTVIWLYAHGFKLLTYVIRLLAWVFTKILLPVVGAVITVLGDLIRTIAQVIHWLGTAKDRIVAWFKAAWTWLRRTGSDVVSGFLDGVKSVWGKVRDWFGVVKAKVVSWVVNPVKWLWSKGSDVVNGFLSGLKAAWGAVTGWVSGIATWIKNHKGPVSLDAQLLVPAGKAIMSGFLGGLKSGAGKAWNFVKSIGGKTKDAIAAGLGWIAGIGWISNVSTSGGNQANMAIGRAMAAQRGWTGAQWAALQSLWMGESGWNNNAQNPTSTAYGIAQFLDSTWASVGASKTSNPAGQIAAGLRYIAQQYGTPANAFGKWSSRRPHWYDQGGMLRPGYTLAYNGTGRAEGIFTAEQMAAIGGGTTQVRVFIGDQELRGIVRTEVDSGIGRQVRSASTRRAAY